MQAEVLARFRPELDAPALIPSIRTAQRAVRACLRRFGSTRHMVGPLLRGRGPGQQEGGWGDVTHGFRVQTRLPNNRGMLFPVHAGVVPGAGVPRGSGEGAVQQACQDPHQAPPGPRRQLGGGEADAARDRVQPIPR